MFRHPKIWIVVADGEHARIVVRQPASKNLTIDVELASPTAGSDSSDLGTDRPGRSYESVGGARHAIEPKHDLHDMEKQNFLRTVAQRVNEAVVANELESLLLVAPPHALKSMRDALSPAARAMVVGELAKDLTKHPILELTDHVKEWISPA